LRRNAGIPLAKLAALGLAVSLALASGLRVAGDSPGAQGATALGTAYLASATCADWGAAGAGRRLAIVATLGLAATGPDPETRGATLSSGGAFVALDRLCSTTASRSTLLYSAYNRAASFQPGAVRPAFGSGGFGSAPHR
jgi:hypothetical protein